MVANFQFKIVNVAIGPKEIEDISVRLNFIIKSNLSNFYWEMKQFILVPAKNRKIKKK